MLHLREHPNNTMHEAIDAQLGVLALKEAFASKVGIKKAALSGVLVDRES
jgi:hypothetical protein